MGKDFYVGIDCGRNTGWAVWNVAKQDFDEIATTTFWGAVKKIADMIYNCDFMHKDVTFVIENPNLHKNVFKRKKFVNGKWITIRGAAHDKISQDVGMNKRDAQLLIQYCKDHLLDVIESQPTAKSNTKLSEISFRNITRYTGGRTSQHGRDAAMLVYKFR